jgi:hypothetical protein
MEALQVTFAIGIAITISLTFITRTFFGALAALGAKDGFSNSGLAEIATCSFVFLIPGVRTYMDKESNNNNDNGDENPLHFFRHGLSYFVMSLVWREDPVNDGFTLRQRKLTFSNVLYVQTRLQLDRQA